MVESSNSIKEAINLQNDYYYIVKYGSIMYNHRLNYSTNSDPSSNGNLGDDNKYLQSQYIPNNRLDNYHNTTLL